MVKETVTDEISFIVKNSDMKVYCTFLEGITAACAYAVLFLSKVGFFL